MLILPSFEIFSTYVLDIKNRITIDLNTIFFNLNNHFLITPNYLKELEREFEDNELMQSLIVQLSDENRLALQYTDNTCDNFIERLFTDNLAHYDCLFGISLTHKPHDAFICYQEINSTSKNKHYLIFELLKKNQLSFHFYDFQNNGEVENLFKCLFELPNRLKTIRIFNRYTEYNYLTFLKQKSIYYYNYIPGNFNMRKTQHLLIERELRQHLGRNLILKSTNNRSIIHERKIFFNNFIITVDQALNNLLVSEPNWKIDIQIDHFTCLNEWLKKEVHFTRLN